MPVREFRTRLSELLSDVADRRDHVLVTRNGKPETPQIALTCAILTTPFTPIGYRQRAHRIYENTKPGGAFILVEKVLGRVRSSTP